MVQLFGFLALVVALLAPAHPAAAAPIQIKYTLTGGNQFPPGPLDHTDYVYPLTSLGGPIASGSLTVTLYASGCSHPPVAGSGVCLRNFAFVTTQGQDFGVANLSLALIRTVTLGPGRALNFLGWRGDQACNYDGCTGYGTYLDIRADEGGLLAPLGARTNYFYLQYSFSWSGLSLSGTYIVGQEISRVPEPRGSLPGLACLVVLCCLAGARSVTSRALRRRRG